MVSFHCSLILANKCFCKAEENAERLSAFLNMPAVEVWLHPPSFDIRSCFDICFCLSLINCIVLKTSAVPPYFLLLCLPCARHASAVINDHKEQFLAASSKMPGIEKDCVLLKCDPSCQWSPSYHRVAELFITCLLYRIHTDAVKRFYRKPDKLQPIKCILIIEPSNQQVPFDNLVFFELVSDASVMGCY